ncbi:MAG: hypothetical protein Q8K78_16795, partial [Planctomycetaceae bacterium]|nr:hypothetical protein [Planctomycetaceae bacterium]
EAQSRVDRERAPFEKIKGKEAQAMNPLDGGAYPGMMLQGETPEMMAGGKAKKRGKAKQNPRKMMQGMMPGMMPGMTMP